MPIGFVILHASDQIVEVEQRYDNLPCSDSTQVKPCAKKVELNIPDDIPRPVFFYYKMTNFYQNHRRYVKSRSDYQLSGDDVRYTSTCDPLETFNGTSLYPCGLIANSYMNDVFNVQLIPNGETTPATDFAWSEKGISWDIDREQRFKDMYKNTTLPPELTREGPRGVLPDLDNEHLMNWMRPAAFPTFKKLYGIINQELKQGDKLTVDIDDQFDNEQYDGEKFIVIANATWIGGKSYFLAYLYIGVGAFCFFMALCVLIKQLVFPRKLGNMANMRKLESIDN
eukprot:UN01380